MNDKFSDKEKTILNGRIYPSIQSCVNNRYKIILGLFAFYSFILTSNIESVKNNRTDIIHYGSIMFGIFICHNALNYFLNEHEQNNYEKKENCWFIRNFMELLFSAVALILVLLAFFTLKKS